MEERKQSEYQENHEQQDGEDFNTAAMESDDSESDSQYNRQETFQSLIKANEKRYLRLFKTLSAKKHPRQRKDMAKIMATTFAAAEVAQLKQGSQNQRFDASSAAELQRALASLFGQINLQTLPQGTMGAFGFTRQRQPSPINGHRATTPDKAREADAEETMGSTLMPNKPQNSHEPTLIAGLNADPQLKLLRDQLIEIKQVSSSLKSDQKSIAKKVKEIRSEQGAKIDCIMQTQELILQQLEKITKEPIQRIEQQQLDLRASRRTVKANETLQSNLEETKQAKQKPIVTEQQKPTVDPMTMSVGSNLLQMLQNPQFQQTNSDRESVAETNMSAVGKATTQSDQFRKCKKGFNFKLDINEIDRIIEEDDSLHVEENQMSGHKLTTSDESSSIGQYQNKVDISKEVINEEAIKIKRKGWGPKQVSPIAQRQQEPAADKSPRIGQNIVTKQGGFRINRTPDLQSSSTDPILALLNKEQNEESKQSDLPLQMKPQRNHNQQRPLNSALRDGSPVIGGGKAPNGVSALNALQGQGNPYGIKQQRQRPTLANGGQDQLNQQPKRAFGGFKAPAKTDLIDQILQGEESGLPASKSPKERRTSSPFLNFLDLIQNFEIFS